MKGKVLGIVLLAIMAFLTVAPVRAKAAGSGFYMIGKGGATFGVSRDTGYAGELGVGYDFKSGVDIFGLEAAIGYYNTSGDISTPTTYSGHIKADTDIVPLSFTGTLGLQLTTRIRVYAGLGLDIAWVSTDYSGHNGRGASIKGSDSEIALGYGGLSRVIFDITDKVFLGIEYKYLYWGNDPNKHFDLNDGYYITQAPISAGNMLMAVFGFRF